MGGYYFLEGSLLEKCGKIWNSSRFSGRLWPDWGNTAWAAMARLGYKISSDNQSEKIFHLGHALEI